MRSIRAPAIKGATENINRAEAKSIIQTTKGKSHNFIPGARILIVVTRKLSPPIKKAIISNVKAIKIKLPPDKKPGIVVPYPPPTDSGILADNGG